MTSNVEFFNSQLYHYVRTMENDGLLDSKFLETRLLKENCGALFFADIILRFCNDADSGLEEMLQMMGQDALDYEKLYFKCEKLKGSAACLGISCLVTTTGELLEAVRQESREECDLSLQRVKYEYENVREKLQIIHQMETRTIPRRGN